MDALVTGASGFLGSHLVERLLERGDHVKTLCRSDNPHLKSLGAEIVRGDLRDRRAVVDACGGVDAVFHAGGVAGLGGKWQTYRETNVLGTEYVVEGCLAHGVKRLIYTSSPSVTFDGRDQKNIDESTPYPTRWFSHYAHSKALAEQHVLRSNGRQGLLTCSLRPHLIWGPGDHHLVPRLWDRARRGWLRRVGDGTNMIDTLYIDNAVDAHLQAADSLRPGSPAAGRAYFLSQGEPVNCWKWLDDLLAIGGLPPTRKTVSLPTAWKIGAICEVIWRVFGISGEPPMCRFLALELATSHYFDLTRAKEDFGFSPQVSLDEGMCRFADYTTSSTSLTSRMAR